MSGSAKAGTTAERHSCGLRMLANADVRAPPEARVRRTTFPLDKDLHGCRLLGSNPDWDMRIGTDTSALLRSASGLPVSVEIVYIALAAPAESGVKERLGWRLD